MRQSQELALNLQMINGSIQSKSELDIRREKSDEIIKRPQIASDLQQQRKKNESSISFQDLMVSRGNTVFQSPDMLRSNVSSQLASAYFDAIN